MLLRDLFWVLPLDGRVIVKTSGINRQELANGFLYNVFRDILTETEKCSIVNYITPQIDENGTFLEISVWR